MISDLFSNGMVFAEGKPFRIFGTGDGDAIASIAGMTAKSKASNGRWVIEFPDTPPASREYELSITENGKEHVFNRIRFGEVWLLAGQSNMEFKLKDDTAYPACAADDVGISFYDCLRPGDSEPLRSGWETATKDAVGNWSAIGWHFAQERRRISGKPIGIVGCNKGASTVQAWLPAAIAEEPRYQLPREEMHNDHFADVYFWNKPGFLYESMFRGLVPFSFTGVIWYQGESNTGSGEYKVYPELLGRMIDAWRTDLCNPALEFRLVTIADFSWRDDDGWKKIQKAIGKMPYLRGNVKVVPCNVAAEERCEIHPPSKGDLARRLAACSFHDV